MTAQVREILYYNGKTYYLATEPLKPLLELMGDEKPAFVSNSTACWRGYVGTWEIDNNRLLLIDLKARTEDVDEFSLDLIFPNQNKVFAEWFSGEIKIPHGKMLHYEHMGYMSIYEKDLFLKFDKGLLISRRELDNTKTFNPEDPLGLEKSLRALYKKNSEDLKKGKASESEEK